MKRGYFYLIPVLFACSSCGMRAAHSIPNDSMKTNWPIRGGQDSLNEEHATNKRIPDAQSKDHDDEKKDERDLGKGSDKEPMPSD